MFCPRCGSAHSDELKFCKTCGVSLESIRRAVESGDAGSGKFDWGNTWVAEMLLSSEEQVRRAKEIERLSGITPEVKRRNEIKAGVITASAGLGVMIVLNVIMQGIILGGNVTPGDAEILRRVWIAGVIPFLVGLALIINGVFVSKGGAETGSDTTLTSPHVTDAGTRRLDTPSTSEYLPPADTSQDIPAGFSITEETTEHLKVPNKRP